MAKLLACDHAARADFIAWRRAEMSVEVVKSLGLQASRGGVGERISLLRLSARRCASSYARFTGAMSRAKSLSTCASSFSNWAVTVTSKTSTSAPRFAWPPSVARKRLPDSSPLPPQPARRAKAISSPPRATMSGSRQRSHKFQRSKTRRLSSLSERYARQRQGMTTVRG